MIIQQFPIIILVVNAFHCLVLIKLNAKIEEVRQDEDGFGKQVITEFNEGTNVEWHGMFNYKTMNKHRKTLKAHSTMLSNLNGKQTAIISEATLSKKAEVYLEASPQAILQLYIIAITGVVSTSQVVTIVVSVLVTTFGTMTTYLKEPTKVIYLN